ncbi:MAG: hypothetical protein LAQ69_34570 [Acidobacteriia bacterium]|nr:hypothetical protein [Terriglobia bacterium]
MGLRAPILFLFSWALALGQPAHSITKIVSAASGAAVVAPNSIATIYGVNLTDRTESATALPLPIQLAGITVVVDGPGLSTGAALIYASPTQINFVVPAGILPGTARVSVVGPEIIFASSTVLVQTVAPALFSANGDGAGVAAAIGIRTVIPTNMQTTVAVFLCDAPSGHCHAIPLDVGIDAPLTLELFGTGIRGGSKISATIGGMPVPVQYAGPQPQFPGLDQVNLPLILSLRGAGTVDIVLTVDGQASNPVQVAIQ